MTDLSEEGVFRAMVEDEAMPKIGTGAILLGVRKGKDIDLDSAGKVHRPAFRPGERNGLSCAATIESLPRFTLPVEWGGLNTKTVVWRIDAADLPIALVVGDDAAPGRNRHLSIGPNLTMEYDEFVRAIEATRPLWTKVPKS